MTSQDSSHLDVKDLRFINDIKVAAIIGPSKKRDYFFVKNHQANFKGNLYVVHPTVKEIPGFDSSKIFKSVKDIPEEIDFVFIAVPPSQILNVMDDCAEKRVKLASIFTAEFSDSGTKEGIELEKELIRRAQNKVRILGPNGMGMFYPKLGIAWRHGFPSEYGNIGFIAQSGGVCNIAIYMSTELGIKFSKVFSFGNAADIDFVDLLNFLSNDPETDLIMCYVEGIKEGRGRALQKVLAKNKKPIIILKGGQSETGTRAVMSHTASIAGENRVWEAMFKQYNAIEVESLEQLVYTAKLIDYYGFFDINNLVIFSISGGYGVILIDLVEKYGMKVPPFNEETKRKLGEKFTMLGTSYNNPLDVSTQIYYSDVITDVMELSLSEKQMDGVILDMPSWYFSTDFHVKKDFNFESNMIDIFSLGHKYNKPIIPIIQRVNCPEDRERVVKKLTEKKVPVFGDPLEFIPLLPKISNYSKKRKNDQG